VLPSLEDVELAFKCIFCIVVLVLVGNMITYCVLAYRRLSGLVGQGCAIESPQNDLSLIEMVLNLF
jgi:hypothetical protein